MVKGRFSMLVLGLSIVSMGCFQKEIVFNGRENDLETVILKFSWKS